TPAKMHYRAHKPKRGRRDYFLISPSPFFALQPQTEQKALFDRAPGVEFRGMLGAANQMGLDAGGGERGVEVAAAFLAGTDDDVVDLEQAPLALDRDVESVIVDALVDD